jgi:uncharacterized protein
MVRFFELAWDDENVEHIARHGVEPHEVQEVIASQRFYMARLRGRRYKIIGQTDSGRYLFVVVDREWDSDFYVVTARTADADERRMYHRHVRRH